MHGRKHFWITGIGAVATLLLPLSISVPSIAGEGAPLVVNEFNQTFQPPNVIDRVVPVNPSLPITVRANQFRILNADEDNLWSNGDEPYLFIAAVFADGTSVNLNSLSSSGVRIKSPATTHGNLSINNVGKGTYVIPESTGTFTTSIRPIAGLGGSFGKDLASVALIVVAMDEDGTSTSAMNKARVAFVSTLKSELDKAVRTLKQPDIPALAARLQDAMTDAVKSDLVSSPGGFLSGLPGVLDPDDFIGSGVKTVSYSQIEAAARGGIPFLMTFKKSGVHYTLSGSFSTP